MKESSVDLYFFSGTGNTLLAARAVAEGLRAGGKSVRLLRLEKGISAPAGDTALGVAVTTACFSTYPFVWEALGSFLRRRTERIRDLHNGRVFRAAIALFVNCSTKRGTGRSGMRNSLCRQTTRIRVSRRKRTGKKSRNARRRLANLRSRFSKIAPHGAAGDRFRRFSTGWRERKRHGE